MDAGTRLGHVESSGRRPAGGHVGYETMTYETRDGIATITMNRPERSNAMNAQWFQDFGAALERANLDPEARVVIITGAGKAFCTGGDMKEPIPELLTEGERQLRRSPLSGGLPMFTLQIRALEKPSIAVVNGAAAGGGLAVALACDVIVASERARFALGYIDRGLIPDSGTTHLLTQAVGLHRACELVFSGEVLDAARAFEYGLCNRVVAHDELMVSARGLASVMARKAPVALRLSKRALYRGAESDLATAVDYELFLMHHCAQTADFAEGKEAFVEKRDAAFQGD